MEDADVPRCPSVKAGMAGHTDQFDLAAVQVIDVLPQVAVAGVPIDNDDLVDVVLQPRRQRVDQMVPAVAHAGHQRQLLAGRVAALRFDDHIRILIFHLILYGPSNPDYL